MKGLTRRQSDVLTYIEAFVKSHGYPPSVREIASHFSLRSASGVHKHIKALVKKNFLEKQDFTSRSIRVMRRSHAPRVGSADAPVWPLYGTLTSDGIQRRSGAVQTEFRPSDTALASGGIVVIVDSPNYAQFGVASGDVLFLTAHSAPRAGDLVLYERGGKAELQRLTGAPGQDSEGLRGVVVGHWRTLRGPTAP
jgi:repressor LexA